MTGVLLTTSRTGRLIKELELPTITPTARTTPDSLRTTR